LKISETIATATRPTFSFELTPPERGTSISEVHEIVDLLMPYRPAFIDVTNHAADSWFEETGGGSYERHITRKRPGTLGLCAALKYRYDVETVPHLLCVGFTKEETEDALIELSFLGIHNVVALRGDHTDWKEVRRGPRNKYAVDLVKQVMDMNDGKYLHALSSADKSNFCVGVAGYPEKHFEAPSLAYDIARLKEKVDAGAEYVITQMFYDNAAFFDFLEKAREAGVTVPIIPGLKVLTRKSLLTNIPRNFHVDIPDDLIGEIMAAGKPSHVKEIGCEFALKQARELLDAGVPGLHFFVYSDAPVAADVLRELNL
jgi:methylenetetrahydrofolate reductase (NADPH)